MCNELYEEKGLTERVDARSYEERGIDKIPMVHEGPNVQAMEARGISTALGSLNRLIRALNDMKERAKNLLQWSLFRESQLMERMVFLHQPTLADYLRNYCDKRNAVAESYAYGTQKAKNTNLKQFAEMIRFLEEQGALKTLPEALQQAAARRLEYPDLSLAALCGCFDPPMSKSGLSHRMKKLEALADALRQRLEEHTETQEAGA